MQPAETQPVETEEIHEQSPAISDASPEPDSQAEQQPGMQPAESQPVAIEEIQEQSPAISAPSPEPDSEEAEQQPDTQPIETDEKQNQAPIEIKSISSEHQQKEDDSDEQPSEFTQTTTEQSGT